MAKTIKRVGIIFFVLVVSLLVAVGSVFAVNVTSNGDMLLADTSTANGNGNNYSGAEKIDIPDIPAAESEYVLNCGCPEGEPCTCGGMARIWTEANKESINTGKNVKVTLGKDWIAKSVDNEYITSFGEGVSFNVNRIAVPYHAEITLDLNGKTIDRGLLSRDEQGSICSENWVGQGNAMIVFGTLNLIDNTYDAVNVRNIYNKYKDNKDELYAQYKKLEYGKITGGSIKHTSNGGGINVNVDATLNMYGGIITENYAYNGGALCVYNSTANIYNGLFFDNAACINGAIAVNNSKVTMTGGVVVFNEDTNYINDNATTAQGTIWVSTDEDFNLSNAIVAYNTTASRGGAMLISYAHNAMISNTELAYNKCGFIGGAVYSLVAQNIVFDNCNVSYNESPSSGGGLFFNRNVEHIEIISTIIEYNSAGGNGGGLYSNAPVILDGAIIRNNNGSIGGMLVEPHTGGAILNTEPIILRGKCTQIYGNTNLKGAESDLYLYKGQKIYVNTRLNPLDEVVTRIGITLASNYDFETCTKGAGRYLITFSWYFFSNDKTKKVVALNNEVAIESTTDTINDRLTWHWVNGDITGETSTDYMVQVPYTGTPYRLTLGNNEKFNKFGNVEIVYDYIELTDAGNYSFHIIESKGEKYHNNVLTFAIVPKEVELVWDTEKVYSGDISSASAIVKEGDLLGDDTCTVTVTGGGINVGKDYLTTATGLSNKNYTINPASKYTLFDIIKADLTIDISTKNQTKQFVGNGVELDKDWFSVATDGLVGKDANLTVEEIFDIDSNAIVPQFKRNGVTTDSAVNVGKYEISVKNIEDASKVFTGNGNYNVTINCVNGGTLTIVSSNVLRTTIESGYDYLLLENNKRVAYKDKGMIHGVDDSNVNAKTGNAQYVIGNIMPETTVETLRKGLVCDTNSNIEVYNKQGNRVADTNAVVGTGWYIEYAGEVIYLSVLGDVTGDGRIDATDITYLRRIANGEVSDLSLAVQLAAMIDNRGKITSIDAEILRAVCKYETTIDMYF